MFGPCLRCRSEIRPTVVEKPDGHHVVPSCPCGDGLPLEGPFVDAGTAQAHADTYDIRLAVELAKQFEDAALEAAAVPSP